MTFLWSFKICTGWQWFHSTQNRSFWRRSPSQYLGLVLKNWSQQKHTFTNQNKYTTTQNKHTKN